MGTSPICYITAKLAQINSLTPETQVKFAYAPFHWSVIDFLEREHQPGVFFVMHCKCQQLIRYSHSETTNTNTFIDFFF